MGKKPGLKGGDVKSPHTTGDTRQIEGKKRDAATVEMARTGKMPGLHGRDPKTTKTGGCARNNKKKCM